MKSLLIGIDPGAKGGIAHQPPNGRPCATSMPDTEGDVLEYLRSITHGETEPIAYVEQVGGFAGKGQPGSAMFNFGRNYGFLLGVLQTLGVRVELVRPQAWQKTFSLGTKSQCEGSTDAQRYGAWKRKLKGKAQQLYPTVEVTLATADCLLILDYAKRQPTAGLR